MNDYYTNIIVSLLKDDIQNYFDSFLKSDEIQKIITKEINEYFKGNEIIFKEDTEKYEIKQNKTHLYRERCKYIHKKDKCIARIWNCGMGGQCSFTGKYDGFCKKHYEKGYDWWLGTIDRPRPERPINHTNKIHKWVN